MKGHAMLIRKLVIGAVCILLAAGLTLVLKEVLDTQEPEQALPILEVHQESLSSFARLNP